MCQMLYIFLKYFFFFFFLSKFQSDKASMLDEAIEYLKSLQMQVQVHLLTGICQLSVPLVSFALQIVLLILSANLCE